MSDTRPSPELGDVTTTTPDPPQPQPAPPIPAVTLRLPKVVTIRQRKPAKWSASRVQLRDGADPTQLAGDVAERDSLFVRMRAGAAGAVAWLSPSRDAQERLAIPLDAPDGSATINATAPVWAWCTGADCELVVLVEVNAPAGDG